MFNKFSENDLFNSSVFEAKVQPIKTRTFKSKGNSKIITVNERTNVISSNIESFYPISSLSMAPKRCNVIKKQGHTTTYNSYNIYKKQGHLCTFDFEADIFLTKTTHNMN